MSSCLAEVQDRSDGSGRFAKTEIARVSEQFHGGAPKMRSPEPENELKRTRVFLSYSTRFFRRSFSFCLTLVVWLFVAEFLFQFAHIHNDGKSLAEEVHAAASIVQMPLEKALGFDARYQFPVSNVDFMPLIIFVALLIGRNRADAALAGLDRVIRGEKKKGPQSPRLQLVELPGVGLIPGSSFKGRKSGGAYHDALRDKVMAIYSE
jgi:hypothetical protein